MSNLLKSKLFLGSMVGTLMLLGATVASASYVHTVTLKFGARSAQVTSLQMTLNTTSCPVDGGLATGYFGSITLGAVKCFQSAHGLVADGVVGPLTGAALAALTGGPVVGPLCPNGNPIANNCMPVNPAPGPLCPNGNLVSNNCQPSGGGGGGLSGGAGDITDVTLLGTPNAEAVGEGESNHKVVGFEVQADNGSDIGLTSVKVEFDHAFGTETASTSTHINDYISGVSIWEGSTKVGSAKIDDFTKTATGVYSKSVSLSGAVVKSDKTERFYIAVDGQDSVDSGDMPEQWGAELTSIRFTDGTGAVLTNNPASGDIQQYFTIESAASASNAKLTLTEASDNPVAGVVQVDDNTDTTDGVPLLKFKMKATGSALWIDQIPVQFTSTPSTNFVTDDTASVTLTVDGQDFSESVAGQDDCSSDDVCTVTFDKLDFTLDEDQSVTVVVSADVNGVGSALDSGDTLQADVTSVERGNMVVEVGDENGDDLGTGSTDRVGTVSGEAQGFYNQGVSVTPGSTMKMEAIAVDAGADIAQATMTFKVTAIGEDVYLEKSVTSSTSTALANNSHAQISPSSGAALALTGATIASSDNNSDEKTNTFKVPNGQTASFTLTLSATSTGGQFRGVLYALMYALSDTATASGVYSLDMGVDGSYKTPYTTVSGT